MAFAHIGREWLYLCFYHNNHKNEKFWQALKKHSTYVDIYVDLLLVKLPRVSISQGPCSDTENLQFSQVLCIDMSGLPVQMWKYFAWLLQTHLKMVSWKILAVQETVRCLNP